MKTPEPEKVRLLFEPQRYGHEIYSLSPADTQVLSDIADQLLISEPALNRDDVFGSGVSCGLTEAPTLLYEDHREIPLAAEIQSDLRYRMLLMAAQDDVYLVETPQIPDFERYCREVLSIGTRDVRGYPVNRGRQRGTLLRSCMNDDALIDSLAAIARQKGAMNIMPYLVSGSVWILAQRIAEKSKARIYVAAPPPRLGRRANDKLWFGSCVSDWLGKRALPVTYTAYGPGALAGEVLALARDHHFLVVKLPSSAGSMGNLRIDAEQVRQLSAGQVRHLLLSQLADLGWKGEFPLAVSAWKSRVDFSPSAQLWIPRPEQGPPILEGFFSQEVFGATGRFIGAVPAKLAHDVEAQLVRESAGIAFLLQRLGYFGRCSLDAVVSKDAAGGIEVTWIECNARWGGVSIPMSVAQRLTGDWKAWLAAIVQTTWPAEFPILPADAIKSLSSILYHPGKSEEGIVLLGPLGVGHNGLLSYMVMTRDPDRASAIIEEVACLLAGCVPASGLQSKI